MTTVNSNLSAYYQATQQKNAAQQKVNDLKAQKSAAKTSKEKNAIQQQINAANRELNAAKTAENKARNTANKDKSSYSVSTGNSKMSYKDVAALLNGVDLDGDGVVSDSEKSFGSEIASKNYKSYSDTTLKSATSEDLKSFTNATSGASNLSKSFNNTIKNTTSTLTKNSKKNEANNALGVATDAKNAEKAKALVTAQNKVETAKALLKGEISAQDAAKDLGADVSNVSADYIKNLETNIDEFLSVNTSLKSSTSVVMKNAKAAVGNSAAVTTKAENFVNNINNSDDEKLKNTIASLPENEQALLGTIDITATYDNGQPKYTIAKGKNDNTYHIYEYTDNKGTRAKTIANVKIGNNNLSVKTKGSGSDELIHVTGSGTKEVGTGEYEKVAVGTETVQVGTEKVQTGTQTVQVGTKKVQTGTEKKWVDAVYETVPAEKTDDEVKDARDAAEMELGEEIGNAINRDKDENRLENANKCKEVVSAAAKEYKNNNITKQTFINTIHAGLVNAIGAEKANEFTRVLNTLNQADADDIDKTIAGSLDNYIDKLLKIIDLTKTSKKLVSEGHYEEIPVYDEVPVYGEVPVYEEKPVYETKTIYEDREITKTVSDYASDATKAQYYTQSPLSLDVNDDGVKTSDKKVNFDIDGDGKLDLINDSADAVLVFDADGDGIAGESGLEVFGNNTDLDGDGKADGFKNGFDALRALGEKEGLLGGDDLTLDEEDIEKLKAKYGLGIKFGYLSETQALNDAGITEIAFGKSNETQTIKNFDGQGNDLMTQEGATFTINGKTNVFADIWHRVYKDDDDEE